MYNIPFWRSCISLILGAIVFSFSTTLPMAWVFVGILITGGISLLLKVNNSTVFPVASSVLFFFLGGLRHQLSLPKQQQNHLVNQQNLGQPIVAIFSIKESYKSSPKWKHYKASAKQLGGNKVSGEFILSVKNTDTLTIKKGEIYSGLLKFNSLKKDGFSYGFDYNEYLISQYITHQVWSTPENLFLLPDQRNMLVEFMTKIQLNLNTALKHQNLDANVTQLTQALVLGNKKELDKELASNFAKAGVMHILAISGLHIGIIYMVFVWGFKLVLFRYEHRVVRSVLVLFLLWMFAWFSGASDSALRATTMFSCFEISRLLLRRQHPLNALFLSVFILFLIDPKIIFSVGFQLSVIAVASIIIGVPKLNILWVPKTFLGKYVWGIICVTLCAQIGLLPLCVYYFHQIPGLFLVANIPVMIGVPFIMGFAILIVLGSYVSIIPEFVIQSYNGLVRVLIRFVNWVASFEGFVLKDLYVSEFTVVGSYLFFVYLRWWYSNYKQGLNYLSVPIAGLFFLGFAEGNIKAFTEEVWLLDDFKKTSIVEVRSAGVQVYSTKEFSEMEKQYKIQPILEELHIKKVHYNELAQVYTVRDKNLVIINNTFIPKLKDPTDIVLITDSPKINLERFIEELCPQQIIIASDNKSYLKKQWHKTCGELGIEYHDISMSGTLRLDKF